MRPVIHPEEAKRLDRESAVPVTTLMERAGRAVALAAVRMGARYGTRVAVLAGEGNNGGDAYVAAQLLRQRGVGVAIYRLGEPRTEAAKAAAGRYAGPVRELGEVVSCDLVIDGLFGGGYRPGIKPEVVEWMRGKSPVLAIDLPSGLDPATGEVAEEAFTADRTVTFGALRLGHLLREGPERSGSVDVVDIGLAEPEPSLWLVEEQDAALPKRPGTAHKWSAGSVLVVGGALGMTGAALLTGRAALRFGAGAVGVLVPEEAHVVAATAAPEMLHHQFEAIPDRYQVLAIGPGLGDQHQDWARKVIKEWAGPVVVDADALALVEPRPDLVVTPHAGEFKKMTGQSAEHDGAAHLAERFGAVVVLKGNPTFIAAGGVPRVVTSGGPELATIGTGDVLAGMIAALLANGLTPVDAAVSAVYWHGRAGSSLAQRETVTAPGLIEEIGRFR